MDYRGEPASIYICWPFLKNDSSAENYYAALHKEMRAYKGQKAALDSVFLGGGDVSSMPLPWVLDTSCILMDIFKFNPDFEFSIEIGLGDVNAQKVNAWKQAGVNRVSIRVTTFKELRLFITDRTYGTQEFVSVCNTIASQIPNISVDLMLGVPGVSRTAWHDMVKAVAALPIKHVSIYLYDQECDEQVAGERLDEDTFSDLYDWTCTYLESHAFKQYELSNFAQEGFESKQNEINWDQKQYVGFGAGAASFDGTVRTKNKTDVRAYSEAVHANENVIESYETISSDLKRTEFLMLNLRRKKGVAWHDILHNLSESRKNEVTEVIAQFIEKKLIVEENGRLSLSRAGCMLENEILIQLL